MGNIIGLFNKRNKFSQEAIENFIKLLGISESQIWIDGNIIMSCTNARQSEKVSHTDFVSDNENGLILVANARIDYKETLCEELGEINGDILKQKDCELILKSYLKWGFDCSQHLFGDYSFAIWDDTKRTLYCSRDHFGCKPFYYAENDSFFAFSNLPWHLNGIPELNSVFDDKELIYNALGIIPEAYKSFTIGINRLEPAHYLLYTEDHIQIRKYWELKCIPEIENLGEQEAISKFRNIFIRSVEQRIRDVKCLAVELSGGLDSSGITSVSAEICTRESIPILAFSHAMSNSYKRQYYPFEDETEYAELLASKYPEIKFKKVTAESKGAAEAIISGLEYMHYPDPQLYSFFSDQLLQEVNKANCTVLLSGVGGDQMVSSFAKGLYSDLINNNDWISIKTEIFKGSKNNSSISTALFYLIRIFPFLIKIKSQIKIKTKIKSNCTYKNSAIIRRLKRSTISRNSYIKSRIQKEESHLRARQKAALGHKSRINRIENSYFIGQKYGIEYRYPMLDVKLIEFYYSLPANLKRRGGMGRYIYREIMKEQLPKQVCFRKDKSGFTIPNLFYRIDQDIPYFKELIDECQETLTYHYFDYNKLRKMAQKVEKMMNGSRSCYGARLFIYSMQILLLQKWQHENKIDIGIKC
jgi:asparagine synthase (glutamine-hydrolysing)